MWLKSAADAAYCCCVAVLLLLLLLLLHLQALQEMQMVGIDGDL